MSGILANFFERRERVTAGQSISGPISFWPTAGKSASGIEVTPETAMSSATVQAIVQRLSSTVAQLNCPLYQRVSGDGRVKAVDDPIHDLINRRPNDEMDDFMFRERMQTTLLYRGNAYAWIERDQFGGPINLWPLRPGMVLPMRTNGKLVYMVHLNQGAPIAMLPTEIFHISGFSEYGLIGQSQMMLGREAIGTEVAYRDFAGRYFSNDGTPGASMTFPEGVKLGKTAEEVRDEKKRLGDELRKGFTGENRHKALILTDGAKYTTIGASPKDSQLRDGRVFQVQEVCRTFNMPPHVIGEMSGQKYNTAEQMSIDFVTFCLGSWLCRWEHALDRQLLLPGMEKEYYFEFLTDGLLRGDMETRARAYNTMIQGGYMTRNEARKKENLNALPGLDRALVPANMQILDDQGEVKTPAATPNDPGGGTTLQTGQRNGRNGVIHHV